jgi:3-oxoacyl-[acyl-carrier-protein] synthase II
MRRRVVVTGAGCVTPLGADTLQVWQRLKEGQSGVGPITLFDARTFPVRMAAEVRDWDMADVGEDPAQWTGQPRQTQFAVAAAIKAWRSSGLDDYAFDPLHAGVFLGCGEAFPDFVQFCQLAGSALDPVGLNLDEFSEQARQACSQRDELTLGPGAAAGLIAARLGLQGPNMNFTSACVSSSMAVGEATEAIRQGDAEIMFAGGAHSMIHPFGITGFHRLSTLSTRNDDPLHAARPFDRERDGFVVGEGAALVVLEELEHARRRGAEIWGEVAGWSTTHDAFRITDLEPEGRSASRCMAEALADAQLPAEDIDYINAHGSGTVVNDKTETLAVKRAFGPAAYRIPLSGTKSMTGHLTTACGAIETVVCLMALREGVVPPTINYETPDPECDLDYVPNTAREYRCRHVMNNTFGFGGQNVSLVLSQFMG